MHRPIVIAAVFLILVAACGTGTRADPPVATNQSPATTEEASVSTTTPSESTTREPASSSSTVAGTETVQACADVIGGAIEAAGDGTYRIDATVRSGDTGWDKYADAWEVRALDGTVLGVRELAHPHETEQPFTRSLSGVEIASAIDEVVLAARDSVNGFCGATFTLDVPG